MWLITIDGVVTESDDFLVDDLEKIEKATKTPWSTANPYRDIGVAKAFMAVALQRQGKSDREVADYLKTVTLKTLKGVFDYRSDDDDDGEGSADPTKKSAPTGRASRRGRPITGGSRPISDDNVSAMSSAS